VTRGFSLCGMAPCAVGKSNRGQKLQEYCTGKMLEEFGGPSTEADEFYAACYNACYAEEVERLKGIGGSSPVEIHPE